MNQIKKRKKLTWSVKLSTKVKTFVIKIFFMNYQRMTKCKLKKNKKDLQNNAVNKTGYNY